MATERLSMRQTREILRQKWRLGRTHREVARSLRISNGVVGTTVLRARAAGLDWALVDTLSDTELQARVYGPPTPATQHRAVPDGAYLPAERRKPGVTLELLHLEYLEDRYGERSTRAGVGMLQHAIVPWNPLVYSARLISSRSRRALSLAARVEIARRPVQCSPIRCSLRGA